MVESVNTVILTGEDVEAILNSEHDSYELVATNMPNKYNPYNTADNHLIFEGFDGDHVFFKVVFKSVETGMLYATTIRWYGNDEIEDVLYECRSVKKVVKTVVDFE